MLVSKISPSQSTSQKVSFQALDFTHLNKSKLTKEQLVSLAVLGEEIKRQKLDDSFYFDFYSPAKDAPKGSIELKIAYEPDDTDTFAQSVPIHLKKGIKPLKNNIAAIEETRLQVQEAVLSSWKKLAPSFFNQWN